jgi:hypothetical protein
MNVEKSYDESEEISKPSSNNSIVLNKESSNKEEGNSDDEDEDSDSESDDELYDENRLMNSSRIYNKVSFSFLFLFSCEI